MRIAIVAQGRFYAFDLCRSLIRRGHDVHVFTNYPAALVQRFGVPPEVIHSFWPHGLLARSLEKLGLSGAADPLLHRTFGRWAAKQLQASCWDVVQTFSGVAEEPLKLVRETMHLMVRASSHIRTQDHILAEEAARIGVPVERPTRWKIAREEREYELSDRIIVLSRFAYASFISEGVAPEKLLLQPLGSDTSAFRPSDETVERRCRRILSGEPLTVMFAGTVSFRKGLYDFAQVTNALAGERFRFRLVGAISPEARKFVSTHLSNAELVGPQPQSQLPQWYAGSDLFLFPTLEDGYGVVLAQAQANSLPLLTTTNSGGPDLITEGETGWVLPIRNANAFIDRLRWCDANRQALADIVLRIHRNFRSRDWDDVAAHFEADCEQTVQSVG